MVRYWRVSIQETDKWGVAIGLLGKTWITSFGFDKQIYPEISPLVGSNKKYAQITCKAQTKALSDRVKAKLLCSPIDTTTLFINGFIAATNLNPEGVVEVMKGEDVNLKIVYRSTTKIWMQRLGFEYDKTELEPREYEESAIEKSLGCIAISPFALAILAFCLPTILLETILILLLG